MKRKTVMVALVWMISAATPAYSLAPEPIEVLILYGPGVSSTVALDALVQLNETMSNSNLSDHVFVNAGADDGQPFLTLPSGCSVGSPDAQVACLAATHASQRDTYDADIVVQVRLGYIWGSTCGAASPEIIDAEGIWILNQGAAYAIGSFLCPIGGSVISHEVAHLLSIEHRTGTDTNDPVRNNHAWTYNAAGGPRIGTVTAQPNDCGAGTSCTEYENKLSSPSYNFNSSVPVPAGEAVHANARQVVRDLSWDVVALYRPKPAKPEPPDTAMLWFSYCVGGLYSYNATWDSSQLNLGDYFEVEYMSGGAWTPWYEGAASCIPLTSTESEMFVRVRVVDVWGQVSVWVILSALGGCGGPW